jgi:hypothetical protein
MLVPGARTGATDSVAFVIINDDVPTLAGQQIGARAVNAGIAGGISAYAVPTVASALVEPATWTIAEQYGSATAPGINGYVVRDTGAFAVRAAAAAAPTTAIASAAAPAGEPEDGLIGALAGYRAAESGLSAWVFPVACPTVAHPLTVENCPAAAGSSAAQRTAYQSPQIVWFVDRIPTPPTGRPAPPAPAP